MLKKIFNREVGMYLVFGILTTLVNILIFNACLPYMNYMIANVIAWFLSVLFAFITNRRYVFNRCEHHLKVYFKEGVSFFGSRITTLIIEMVILFIFIQWLHISELITKIIAQFVVIVANYILSKWFVFK